MNATIKKLLDTAPEIDNPVVKSMRADENDFKGGPPRRYLDCQVVLKSGYQMAGVITTGDEDGFFVMGSIAQTPDKRVLIAMHHFAATEVEAIVVGKELPDQLVKPVRNGGPIILGH